MIHYLYGVQKAWL